MVKLTDFHNQFHDCKENLFSNHINFKEFNFNFNSSNKTSKEKHWKSPVIIFHSMEIERKLKQSV